MGKKSGAIFFTAIFIALIGLLFPEGAAADNTVLLRLKVFPQEYELSVDGEKRDTFELPEHKRGIRLTPGEHRLRFSAGGYEDKTHTILCAQKELLLEEKLERTGSRCRRLGAFPTGVQPKSVAFTPGGNYIVTALLEGRGIQVVRADTLEPVPVEPLPEEYAGKIGFVELAFVEHTDELWVSQMTTGTVHVYDLDGFRYKTSIDAEGNWSKVILISEDETRAYVSNWLSEDISVIDVDRRKTLHTIPVGGTPRGMVLSKDGNHLYVCRYDSGTIEKIDLARKKVVKTLTFRGGAKRHIVTDRETDTYYVSDMYWGSIFIFSGKTDTLLKEVYVGPNPNTIDLTSDGRYLFVATRGKNNPESYRLKGRFFGKILVLDTKTNTIADWFWGRNQPTGLDVSCDDRLLAYSNFLDDQVEVYATGLAAGAPGGRSNSSAAQTARPSSGLLRAQGR
jgi:YVTN family beta-propeller protein